MKLAANWSCRLNNTIIAKANIQPADCSFMCGFNFKL